MSSSAVPIPKRKQRATSSSYWSSSSASSSYASPDAHNNSSFPSSASSSSISKSKAPASVSSTPPYGTEPISPRRPSLLGSSLSKSEYTVINLGRDDGPPRLVTCVKSSQGFDWNQELFLPSYADYDSHDLEHRQDPVQDIVLSDEEAAAMMPK